MWHFELQEQVVLGQRGHPLIYPENIHIWVTTMYIDSECSIGNVCMYLRNQTTSPDSTAYHSTGT
jgi:hypothetical protein